MLLLPQITLQPIGCIKQDLREVAERNRFSRSVMKGMPENNNKIKKTGLSSQLPLKKCDRWHSLKLYSTPDQGHYEQKNVAPQWGFCVTSHLTKQYWRKEGSNVYKCLWLKRKVKIEKNKVSEQAWRFSGRKGQKFCILYQDHTGISPNSLLWKLGHEENVLCMYHIHHCMLSFLCKLLREWLVHRIH